MSALHLFYLLKILKEETDYKHTLTLQDIQDKLNNRHPDYSMKETGVRNNLQILQQLCDTHILPFKFDIQPGFHNQFRYRLIRPKFGLNEARLAFDSISASPFLSSSQKQDLLTQMEALLSHYDMRRLRNRLQTRSCLLSVSQLPETLDKLYQAIDDNYLVSFDYCKFDLHGNRILTKHYSNIQPLRIVWADERHYLQALNPEHSIDDQQRCYRADRMQNVQVMLQKGIPYDMTKLRFGQFDMFSYDKTARVTFRIQSNLWDMVYEKFQDNLTATEDPDVPGCIRFDTKVELSKGFYRWVLQQGPELEVLAPAAVREEVKHYLQKSLSLYQNSSK